MAPAIRATALALILDGDRILVSEGRDDVKRETFYRLLGGGIEFGETGADAVAREVREEVGARERRRLPRDAGEHLRLPRCTGP